MREHILYCFHETPFAGHQGRGRTYGLIKRQFYWPGLYEDVKRFCAKCESCALRKPRTLFKKKAPLQFFPAIEGPFVTVALDLVGPLPMTANGNKWILSFIDLFSKYPETIPVPNHSAETIARCFVDQIIC